MREAGVTFESRLGPSPPSETRVLHDGLDFDEVVLALPAGVLRGTPEAPSCLEPLLHYRPQLRAMADGVNLVPSIAAQLWCGPTTEELGWDAPRPAMVCWAQPFAVWADMSPVLRHEGWGAGGPRSTHYLCGAWHTDLHRAPAKPSVLRDASAAAHAAAREQFEAHGAALWPAARTSDGRFDWSVLHDPDERKGVGRLEAQYVSANIEPSDLCDGASVGTSCLRPEAHESGLSNVVLAGTWTRTNVNSTCVEAATISGLAAARVLTGDERPIFSEFFMQRPRPVVVRERQRREESTWKVM